MNTNDIALDIILQHTASAEWEDVVDMNWTTAELQELLIKALQQANGVNTENGKALPIHIVSGSACPNCKETDITQYTADNRHFTRQWKICNDCLHTYERTETMKPC